MSPAPSPGEVHRSSNTCRVALPDVIPVIEIYKAVVFLPAHRTMGRRVIGMIVQLIVQRHFDAGGNIAGLAGCNFIGIPVPPLPVIPEDELSGRGESSLPSYFFLDQPAGAVKNIEKMEILTVSLLPLLLDAIDFGAHSQGVWPVAF